jgi:hypothetical protein
MDFAENLEWMFLAEATEKRVEQDKAFTLFVRRISAHLIRSIGVSNRV